MKTSEVSDVFCVIETEKVSENSDTFESGDIIFALAQSKISRGWQQVESLVCKGFSKI